MTVQIKILLGRQISQLTVWTIVFESFHCGYGVAFIAHAVIIFANVIHRA